MATPPEGAADEERGPPARARRRRWAPPGPPRASTSRSAHRAPTCSRPACGSAARRCGSRSRRAATASTTASSPASRSGTPYGIRAHGPWDPWTGCGSTRPSCSSTRTPAPSTATSRWTDALTPGHARRPVRRPTRATRRRSSRAASSSTDDFDWGDDDRTRDVVGRDRRLRDAREGLHRAAPARPEALRGTYAGPGPPGGDRAPALARCHRRRAAAGPPVRRRAAARGARRRNYWGYSTLGFFAPHAATPPTATRRPGRASSRRWCAGPARRGARGDPRRRLQPHLRGRPGRPVADVPRPRRARPLQARSAQRHLRRHHRAAATPSTSATSTCCAWCWTRCATGSPRCTSTGSGSTSRPR